LKRPTKIAEGEENERSKTLSLEGWKMGRGLYPSQPLRPIGPEILPENYRPSFRDHFWEYILGVI